MTVNIEEDVLFKEVFGSIIGTLDEIENYEIAMNEENGAISSSYVNTIPYGIPSGCHERLVVIFDGKKDIGNLFHWALKHVGITCKRKTKYILFYITNENVDWKSHWMLYKPSFEELKDKYGIQYFFYFKKQFKAELQKVKNELNNFEHIKNLPGEVSEAIVLVEANFKNRTLIVKTIFANTNSHSYFSFKVQANKNVINNPVTKENIDITEILEKIKKVLLSDHKIDASINVGEDFLPELTFSQIISSESELEFFINFCKKEYPRLIKRIGSIISGILRPKGRIY